MKRSMIRKGMAVNVKLGAGAQTHAATVIKVSARNEFMSPREPARVVIILDGRKREWFVKPRQLTPA